MAVSMKNIDVAFHNVGGKPGTEVWRIENFSPVLLPKSEHGKFYTGDSYIVLRTTALKSGAFHYDLHFWLGKATSQDEAGAAAIKTVELDAALGGRAVQYRESQGHETDLFLSYFKPCMIPLEGGVASGFKKVEAEEFESCLYLCKGARLARVSKVPYVRQSLNHDDVFILDTKEKIYQFNGANSSIQERGKALEVVQHLKDTNHDGNCTVVIVEDGKLGAEAEAGEFWALFGGFAPLGRKGNTHEDSVKKTDSVKPFCVVDGKLKEVEAVPAFKRDMLESNKCYLLDSGSEIYVWMGRETSLDDRKAVALCAEELLSNHGRSSNINVTRIIEGFETPKFKSFFDKWPRSSHSSVSEDGRGKVAALLKQQGVDVKGLLKGAPTKESAPPVLLDSTGKLEVWRVDGNTKISLSPEEHFKFFDAHCYIMMYTYHGERKEDFLICTWLGKNHKADDKAEAVLLTTKMSNRLKGRPVQVRIYQGKEPPQFLALLPCLIILEGNTTSEFSQEAKYFLRIQGTAAYNSLAVQVEPIPMSLNSSECFLLLSGKICYVWNGSFTSTEQQKVALKVASLLKLTAKPIKEGTEPSAFWNALGGKQTGYPTQREIKDLTKNPRLFHCTHIKGKLEVKEIFNFDQDDLLTEEVLILDTYTELYVWVGQHASAHDKQHALDLAQEYLDQGSVQDGLSPKTTVYKIPEGNEPPFFTSFFPWNAAKVMVHADTYNKRLAILQGRKLQAVENPDDSHTQRKTAMAALSSVLNSPSDYPTSPRSSVGGSPRTPGQINSASSQRAAALAALSAALQLPPSEPTSFAPDGDWVAVSSPSMKVEVLQSSDGESETGSKAKSEDEIEESVDGTYEYERLKTTSTHPYHGINARKRESYLSDEDFQKLFGMEKAEFYELPKWKQEQRKRIHELF